MTTHPIDLGGALRAAIEGEVVLPGDDAWDSARQAWNLAADQRPEAVVFPTGSDDVKAAIDAAREAGLRLAAQGTGHGAPGGTRSLDGALLLNMARLTGFGVDAGTRTARVEAGVVWAPVVAAAEAHGLAPLSGSAPDVGVVGYTLGGGIGWLGRKYGLAANSVTAVELVTADGEMSRASESENGDLFWALRGGGGNFGVVTALEFELHPVPELYAGNLFWPIELASDVLNAYREWVTTVPDELTSVGRLLQLPPIPEIPEPFRGNSFVVVESAYIGSEVDGSELLRPLRELAPTVDTVQTMTPSGLPALHMDPPQPVPGIGDGMLVTELTPDAIAATLAVAGPGTGSPLLSVEFRQLGGALARGGEGHGAVEKLDAEFAHYGVGMAMSPEMGTAVEVSLERLHSALEPWRAGRFMNFSDRPAEMSSAFPAGTYERLCEIKAAVDPTGLFKPSCAIGA